MNENVTLAVRWMTRREFLRGMSAVAASAALAGTMGGCGGQPSVSKGSGQLDFLSWEGYDMLAATEQWRKDNNIDLKSAYIGSSEDVPAKVLSPAGAGIDVITYFYAYYKSWADLGLFESFAADEVPNMKRMYPYFQEGEYWRLPDKSYMGVPFTWLTYVCNYRSDLIEPPQSWEELASDKYKGKLAIVEDPGANILVAATVLGIQTDTMTRAELEETKKFLLALKANAKTIAPSYGDLSNLLISGEVVAGFVGWAALDLWAGQEGVPVKSVLPPDGVVISIDAYAMPRTVDNRDAALAWMNLMLTDEVQLAVANELLTATVCPDTAKLIADPAVKAMYDYDNFNSFVQQYPLHLFPPNEVTGDQVTFADWLKAWEEIKAA
ncbi:MAG: extracellular solute-binding protein [Anaerolineae bacterium]|jgi:putative spermidine/putrescine transport system substrate-binding protein/spermidine/putrescine transport system substrate-binding protein|nr:extracellular solute-binding protein [Anaerolineae bacterium]MDX9828973.1 extracellular solute-binding protein [Anaerolineae bacterium]